MKILKKDLMGALNIVKPALSTNDSIAQATSFCFLNNHVVTYNDEISISTPLELELEGAINSKELFAFISKCKADELDIELLENEIIIKAGKATAGLLIQAEVSLPISEIGEPKKWIDIPEDFLKALSFCAGATSRDTSNPILTCVHINGGLIEGAEGFRIANWNLKEPLKLKPFLLPASVVSKVIAFAPVQISEGKGWAHFINGAGAVLSCRIFNDKYVDTSKHMVYEGDDIEFPNNIVSILDLAQEFCKNPDQLQESVLVSFKKGNILIHSTSESGWYKERAKTNYKGDDISFNITPYLLKDILKDVNVAKLSKNKLIFSSENWMYLTMLRA